MGQGSSAMVSGTKKRHPECKSAIASSGKLNFHLTYNLNNSFCII